MLFYHAIFIVTQYRPGRGKIYTSGQWRSLASWLGIAAACGCLGEHEALALRKHLESLSFQL